MKIYGVIDNDNVIHDVSKTEKGAKCYATLHGYNKVGYRPNGQYYGIPVAEKINNKWVNIN